ncbi:MAG TPA: metalloregulator ArsR/SmtB family transcription factor [Longimicrobiales bacterium]
MKTTEPDGEGSMPRVFTDEALELIAARFKVLAEPMRLRILNALRGGEKGVMELVNEMGAGQANISKHLGLLHRHRMVSRRKEGLHVYYRIADPSVLELCELVCSSLESELAEKRAALDG